MERVTDELVGDIGLNIIGKIQIVLRGVDVEGFENSKYGLPKRYETASIVMCPASTEEKWVLLRATKYKDKDVLFKMFKMS